ncbi:MAG: hypothetical protein FD167_2731, partial [bacterium]
MKSQDQTCPDLNIDLFVRYCRGELSRDKEGQELEEHCKDCEDCRFNFAYIQSILKGKERLSIDEKTKLLRYTCDPIWHLASENARNRTKRETLEQVRILIARSQNAQSPPKVEQKAATLLAWNFTSRQKMIASLATVVFLVINIIPIYSYFSSKVVAPSLPTITQQNQNLNLYQQLDSAIDKYLATLDPGYIEEANNLANQIQEQYQDKYAVDLVAYYRSVETKNFGKLEYLRQEVKELDKAPFSANETDSYLARVQKAEQDLLILGNILESYRAKYLLANRYLLIGNTAYEPILDNGISYSESNGYLFLKVYFLVSKAKSEGNDPDELQAKARLEGIFALSKQLQLNDIIPTIAMSLAGVCQKHGENKKALKMSE